MIRNGPLDADAKVVLDVDPPYFAQDIIFSELLSRGWVFQEVRLTPANLFCASNQAWWCCSEATVCETCPEPGRDKISDVFHDYFRNDRELFISPTSLSAPVLQLSRWLLLLALYSGSSVSNQSDKLVAVAGLAKFVQKSYAQNLQNVEYHSGLWTTEIARQLVWQRDPGQQLPKTRFKSTHPIPSWSPLSCDGMTTNKCKDFRSGFLPIEYIETDTSGHDELGRAKDAKGCMLHLRGVLVPMETGSRLVTDKYERKVFKAHPKGFADVNMDIHWDSIEDKDAADAAAAAGHPFDHRALICLNGRDLVDWSYTLACGILLRPLSPDEQPRLLDEQPLPLGRQVQHGKPTQRWVRCGCVEQTILNGYVSDIRANTAFALGSYGKGHEEETPKTNVTEVAGALSPRLYRPFIDVWQRVRAFWRRGTSGLPTEGHSERPKVDDIYIY